MAVSLESLLTPGVLGFYKSFEAIEIFAIPPDQRPINVLTVIAAEESEEGVNEYPQYLTKKLIRLKSLNNWSFGIQSYRRPIIDLQVALDDLVTYSEWRPSSAPSRTGRMVMLPHVFVPPDSSQDIPLNRVLKNNFWNGSHILEWGDRDKNLLKPLFDDPRHLQSLAEQVETIIPIRFSGLSDRLGNVIVQLPVRILMTHISVDRSTEGVKIEIAWAAGATSRPLLATYSMEYDRILTGLGAARVIADTVVLPPAGRGELRVLVWDDQYQIALAATAPTGFIRSISIDMRLVDNEPRVFSVTKSDGTLQDHRVSLMSHTSPSLVGEKSGDDIGGWTQKRMYQERASQLAEQRRFKVYRCVGDPDIEHLKALNDIRVLIAQYAKNGAWLWDPYLGADDIVETLFHCPFNSVSLRALTAGKHSKKKKVDFIAGQRAALEAVHGNLRGLRLEFRARNNQGGWPFHDRFLIFPDPVGGALAWSLGTSVKSFGKAHHILQQVDNGQLIADSFQDLWDALSEPLNLVWKI